MCFEGFLWIVVFHFLPKILALYIVLMEKKHSQGHFHETKQEINSHVSKFFISIFFRLGDGWRNNIFHDTAKFFHELTLFKIALLCPSVAKFIPLLTRLKVSKRWLIADYCHILKGQIATAKYKTRSGLLDIKKKLWEAILDV